METEPTFKCPHCRYDIPHGATVCRGCLGTVVYGPTDAQLRDARRSAGGFTAFAVFALLYLLPIFLAAQFHLPVQPGFGTSIFGLLLPWPAAVWAANKAEARVRADKADHITVFRRG